MPTCFVIQPFDQGPFDKRYEDVIDPAIRAAGLEPYRVDRDPHASIPIEQIEAGIRAAAVCVADITTDNPNVWFELGFAIAEGKDVVLVAAATRKGFPFDVQHRNVIGYQTESSSDFDALKQRITMRLKAEISKEANIERAAQVESPLNPIKGLSSHELVALVAIAQNLDSPTGTVGMWTIRQDMERAGFTPVAVTLGIAALLRKGLVVSREMFDREGDPFTAYSVGSDGFEWLHANEEKLVLRKQAATNGFTVTDDDVPF